MAQSLEGRRILICHPRQMRSERSNADPGSSANAISEANDSIFSMGSSPKAGVT